jgi:hypothetical protein
MRALAELVAYLSAHAATMNHAVADKPKVVKKVRVLQYIGDCDDVE